MTSKNDERKREISGAGKKSKRKHYKHEEERDDQDDEPRREGERETQDAHTNEMKTDKCAETDIQAEGQAKKQAQNRKGTKTPNMYIQNQKQYENSEDSKQQTFISNEQV